MADKRTLGLQPLAVAYARVSSREQEKEGFSIPAQLRLIRAYADNKGLRIVREFTESETARQSGRAAFAEMLAFIRESSCRVVLVEKTDRLYRNLKDWVIIDELSVEVHFVKESVVISPESGSSAKFLHGIKVLMAKNYCDNLSEEVKKGMTEKAEQGHWPSVAPLGYINNRETHLIEPDPERAGWLQNSLNGTPPAIFPFCRSAEWLRNRDCANGEPAWPSTKRKYTESCATRSTPGTSFGTGDRIPVSTNRL